MSKTKKTHIAVLLDDKQMDFIHKFAAKRGISKSEAIRIIVEGKRQTEERGSQL